MIACFHTLCVLFIAHGCLRCYICDVCVCVCVSAHLFGSHAAFVASFINMPQPINNESRECTSDERAPAPGSDGLHVAYDLARVAEVRGINDFQGIDTFSSGGCTICRVCQDELVVVVHRDGLGAPACRLCRGIRSVQHCLRFITFDGPRRNEIFGLLRSLYLVLSANLSQGRFQPGPRRQISSTALPCYRCGKTCAHYRVFTVTSQQLVCAFCWYLHRCKVMLRYIHPDSTDRSLALSWLSKAANFLYEEATKAA